MFDSGLHLFSPHFRLICIISIFSVLPLTVYILHCENTSSVFTESATHPELLLLGQQVVVLVALVQSHQNVLQPVPHTQGELAQLAVHAGLNVCREKTLLV